MFLLIFSNYRSYYYSVVFISTSSSSQFCVCLTVIFILQLVAGVLGFVFADKVWKINMRIN